ncbi:hypothetical protein C0995_010261 [Termitomyces sp. Mi166|nr:hypothetical protein C0995_010261 [Termitomyces sp. Mi166\
MITPRPILKARPTPSNMNEYFPSPTNALPFKVPVSPHVHYPPTPTLTDIQMTHSPFVYDRAPIVVLPNACKLPERGGRNYDATTSPSAPSWRRMRQESDFDVQPHEDEDENPPSLVHDHSSESDDSDACISSPTHTDNFEGIPSKSENTTTSDAPAT